MINEIDFLLDGISSVHTQTIELREPFLDFASKFASDPGTVILLSNNNTDCGKYNILGWNPWLSFYGKHKKINLTVDGNRITFEANPLDVLKQLLEICDASNLKFDVPIGCGLLGYLAYDLKNHIEKLSSTTIDDLDLPDICFFLPSIIVIHDILKNVTKLFITSSKRSGPDTQKKILRTFKYKLNYPSTQNGIFYGKKSNFKSNFAKNEYIDAVKKIKNYILKGDVYQVNMSQRFCAKFKGNGFTFFRALYDINPTSFFAYINAKNHEIISTSPERLVMRKNQKIEARPIKGTRPRGQTKKDDTLMKEELLESHKDDAELSMIVDLLRNDLGKICKAGTVKVNKHKKIEAYSNVYHLISIIKGEINNSTDNVDIIRAVFPGGSITGCPKIRSMEIIDELETNRRHIYTGSIGYISFHKTMDLSVAIRTATIVNSKIYFSVGGGIVYDSNPEDEFEETLHKGQTIMDVFSKKTLANNSKNHEHLPFVWFNGIIRPANIANISVFDLGVMYGFGLFETIYLKNGTHEFLEEHISRLNNSWRILFQTKIPDLSWDEIIKQICKANKIERKNAAIKIIITRGLNKTPPDIGSIIVTARNYNRLRLTKNRMGYNTGIYPQARHTPLASHKTLNYLYYHLARIWSINNGFDESIILNTDGSISEGNSSNIVLIYAKKAILPDSKFVLPGIMLNEVVKQLKKNQYEIITRPVEINDLFSADAAFLTNSLIGVVPLISVNNKPLKFNLRVTETIRKFI